MRLILRWDADRADAVATLEERERAPQERATRLSAILRLGLWMASTDALARPELDLWLDRLLAAPAIRALGAAGGLARTAILEVCSAAEEGKPRRCARLLVRWDGERWRRQRPVGRWGAPLARLHAAWQNAPASMRTSTRSALLLSCATITLLPHWWRYVESYGNRAGLRLLPATWPAPPPPLGVLLVAPAADPGARNSRAAMAEALDACLALGVPWVALDVPINRGAPDEQALWQSLSQHAGQVLVGVEPTQAEPLHIDWDAQNLAALMLPFQGYRGGAPHRLELNYCKEPTVDGDSSVRWPLLPTLSWAMAERLIADGASAAPAYFAPGRTQEWAPWTPFAIPAGALGAAGDGLLVREHGQAGWEDACRGSGVRGAVIAFADWHACLPEEQQDRQEFRVAGDLGRVSGRLDGVRDQPSGALVPGPIAQALFAQALVTGPSFRTWDLVVADALSTPMPLTPCERGGARIRAVDGRSWEVGAGVAIWLLVVGAAGTGAFQRAGTPVALLKRLLLAEGALLAVTAAGLMFARVYLPALAGSFALMLLAVARWLQWIAEERL